MSIKLKLSGKLNWICTALVVLPLLAVGWLVGILRHVWSVTGSIFSCHA